MPNAYHHVFFTVRDGISDDEVIERFRRFRDLAVGKGYIKSADDFSVGKVVIPAGGDDEVARIRQMTGGFTWAETVRFDGRRPSIGTSKSPLPTSIRPTRLTSYRNRSKS